MRSRCQLTHSDSKCADLTVLRLFQVLQCKVAIYASVFLFMAAKWQVVNMF